MNRRLLLTTCCTAAALVLSYCGKKKKDSPAPIPNQTVATTNKPAAPTPGSKALPPKGTVAAKPAAVVAVPAAPGAGSSQPVAATTSVPSAGPCDPAAKPTVLEGVWLSPVSDNVQRRISVCGQYMYYEVFDLNDASNTTQESFTFSISGQSAGDLTSMITYDDSSEGISAPEYFMIDKSGDGSLHLFIGSSDDNTIMYNKQ